MTGARENPLVALMRKKQVVKTTEPAVTEKVEDSKPVAETNPLVAMKKAEESAPEFDTGIQEAEEVDLSQEDKFKLRLNKLDAIIQSDFGITDLNLSTVRSYVKYIMMELTTNPELDNLLVDRDVHNVLTFIRTIRVQASAEQVVKTQKTQSRAASKKKGGLTNDVFAGMELPSTLDALSKLKT